MRVEPENVLRIALDYDNTWTADPPFWREFVRMCRARGHDCRIVTARDERHDLTEALFKLEREIPIIFCRGIAKQYHCEHFAKWVPHIWIDDKVINILNNSATTPEGLVDWRSNRGEGINYART